MNAPLPPRCSNTRSPVQVVHLSWQAVEGTGEGTPLPLLRQDWGRVERSWNQWVEGTSSTPYAAGNIQNWERQFVSLSCILFVVVLMPHHRVRSSSV